MSTCIAFLPLLVQNFDELEQLGIEPEECGNAANRRVTLLRAFDCEWNREDGLMLYLVEILGFSVEARFDGIMLPKDDEQRRQRRIVVIVADTVMPHP
jgi:hypothetical protein